MKSILNYINERQSNDRPSSDFTIIKDDDPRLSTEWKEGDKVLLMKYDGDGRDALCWGIETIKKVNAKSIIIDTDNTVVYKFDGNGIFRYGSKRRYGKPYYMYFVLYNADLISKSPDIRELLDTDETHYYSFPTYHDGEQKKRFLKALKDLENFE